jgi:hypothetical protein
MMPIRGPKKPRNVASEKRGGTRGEEPQKNKLVGTGRYILADGLTRRIGGPDSRKDDQGKKDHETAAAKVVRQFFPKND